MKEDIIFVVSPWMYKHKVGTPRVINNCTCMHNPTRKTQDKRGYMYDSLISRPEDNYEIVLFINIQYVKSF